MRTILILPDGETWSTIDCCSICVITDEDFERLCNDEVDANDIIPMGEIVLGDCSLPDKSGAD
jgi:hypothetical protein